MSRTPPGGKALLVNIGEVLEAVRDVSTLTASDNEFMQLRVTCSELYWRCSRLSPIAPTSDLAIDRVVDRSELETLEAALIAALGRAEKRRLQRVLLPAEREKVRLSKAELRLAAETLVLLFDHLTRIAQLSDIGEWRDALWLCYFGYWSEWGEGTLQALRTLHVLVNPDEVIFYR